MKLTLIYSDIPFWRAEVIRLPLYIGNITFEDRRVSREEFDVQKKVVEKLQKDLIKLKIQKKVKKTTKAKRS